MSVFNKLLSVSSRKNTCILRPGKYTLLRICIRSEDQDEIHENERPLSVGVGQKGLQRFSVSVALEDDVSGMLCRYGLSTPDRNCSANIALFLPLHGHQIICIRLWGLLLKTFVETT